MGSLSQSSPHMDLTPHTPPSHCILQVLLVSPPTRQTSLNISSQERTKPFSPWKPGDAYSVEDDLTDWRLLLGSIDDGDQTRYWDHKDKRWYYHSSSQDTTSTHDTGTTGGLVVVVLIILLTLYSLRRLWVVWAEILNFDGTNSPRGWDFVVQWVLHIIKIRRRRRRKKSRNNNNNNGHQVRVNEQESSLEDDSPRENGDLFQENDSVVINCEESRPDISVHHQVIHS